MKVLNDVIQPGKNVERREESKYLPQCYGEKTCIVVTAYNDAKVRPNVVIAHNVDKHLTTFLM